MAGNIGDQNTAQKREVVGRKTYEGKEALSETARFVKSVIDEIMPLLKEAGLIEAINEAAKKASLTPEETQDLELKIADVKSKVEILAKKSNWDAKMKTVADNYLRKIKNAYEIA